MQRRERIRRLIELGGLVQKSGLVDVTADDHAMIYGALLSLAEALAKDRPENVLALWRRRGQRAFAAEDAARAAHDATGARAP